MRSVHQNSVETDWLEDIRSEFPILSRQVHGQPLVYLDNAATLQKPRSVIESLRTFYEEHNSNVHRSVHLLSQESTELYESVRQKVCHFLGFGSSDEVVFSRGTTHSINMIAAGLANQVGEGDHILITRMEHHANFVPWQELARKKKAHLDIAELNSDFRIDLEDFKKKLLLKPKIVSFSGISNVLGTKNPVKLLCSLAKEAGAWVVVDMAQSLIHFDRLQSDFDFIAFSSHKIGGPTGVGVLWGRKEALELLEPSEFGGDMISEVRDQASIWNQLPWRLEAGTPNFADAIGMGTALEYLKSLDPSKMLAHENAIVAAGLDALGRVEGLRIIGPSGAQDRAPIFSFTLDGIHPHDLGTFLDTKGIAIRAGHHCAQPLHFHFGIQSSTRASFAFYNSLTELDQLSSALLEAKKFFGGLR